MDAIVFYVSGFLSVIAALLVVTRRNPIYSTIFLILFFCLVSIEFLVLRAPFLAVIQVFVYAGAIMVLFVFVIMLLNLSPQELRENVSRLRKVAAGFASALLFLLLAYAIRSSRVVNGLPEPDLVQPVLVPEIARAGEIEAVGQSLFHSHVLAFEFSTALVLVAIVGAIYLTKKRKAPALQDATAPASVRPASMEPSREDGPP